MKKIIIDCDKKPTIRYEGWKIEEHKKMGKLKWNPDKIELYLSDKQKNGYIEGNELRKELEDKPVLNACVLDCLLEHPNLIPDSWKEKYVYFWGTIFRVSDGLLYVECLFWLGGRWNWRYDWLDYDWHGYDPAALLASYPSVSRKIDPDLALGALPLILEINGIKYKKL